MLQRLGLLPRKNTPARRDAPVTLGYHVAGDGSVRAVNAPMAGKSDGLELPNYARAIGGLGGVDVNGLAQAYVASVWAFRCIALKANAIARMPWRVVDVHTRKEIPGHPLTDALHRNPRLFRKWPWALDIWGECFVEKARNAYGYPRDLVWLNPMGVDVDTTTGRVSAINYTPPAGGQYVTFSPDDVAFARTDNPFDDLRGLSPFLTVMTEIGIDADLSRTVRNFYANDARPGVMFIPKTNIGTAEAQRFIDYWKANFQGAKNAGKPVVMPFEMDLKEVQRAPTTDDVTLRESMRREIAAAFGVPLSLAGAWDEAQYQSLPEQRQSFYEETIMALCMDIADDVNVQIMPFFDGSARAEFEWVFDDILALSAAGKLRSEALAKDLASGGITVNQYRQEKGYEPIPTGDVLYVPAGVVVTKLEDLGKAPPPAPSGGFPFAPGAFPQRPVTASVAPHNDAGVSALPAPQNDAPAARAEGKAGAPAPTPLDELGAWERKALSKGATKALGFRCDVLPEDAADAVRAALANAADKAAIRRAFADARAALKATWRESDHPRADDGRFGNVAGSNGGGDQEREGGSEGAENNRNNNRGQDENRRVLEEHGRSQEEVEAVAGVGNLDEFDLPHSTELIVTPGKNGRLTVAVDASGDEIEMKRLLVYGPNGEPDYVFNDRFVLSEERQGEGLGTQIFSGQVEAARESGFKRIITTAERSDTMNGYYTWARLGYDAPIVPSDFGASEMDFVFEGLESTDGEYRLSDVMSTSEGRDWWKENGNSIDMEFDLTPGSRSSKILEAYLEERRGKAMSADGQKTSVFTDLAFSDDEDAALDRVWASIELPPPSPFQALDRVHANSANDNKAGRATVKTNVPPALAETVVTPDEPLDYWRRYDDLLRDIGDTWMTDYMARAYDAIPGSAEARDEPALYAAALDAQHADLERAWVGTEDEPGLLTQLILAGMAAGNEVLLNDARGAPDRVKADPLLALAVDWNLMPREAVDFARNYFYTLIRGVDDTTVAAVQAALSDWLARGGTDDELRAALDAIFHDPRRAALIAQTESNRAYTAGSIERYKRAGVQEVEWFTVRDAASQKCPICGPLHATRAPIDTGWPGVGFPPGHPSCRCWTRAVI